MRSLTLVCIPLLLSLRAGAEDLKLGPGGCLVVSDLKFSPATGNPEMGQGPYLRGKLQNSCKGQMTLTGTAIFSNGDNQVGDSPIAQTVGKGLTVTFEAAAVTPESAKATTASLSNAQAFEQ